MLGVDIEPVSPVLKGTEFDTLRESAIVRLVYIRKSNGKLWVQKIELGIQDVERRLFDVLLVSWGKSKIRLDLDFIMAMDEDGAVLGTIEGLTHYVAHSMNDARKDYIDAVSSDQGD